MNISYATSPAVRKIMAREESSVRPLTARISDSPMEAGTVKGATKDGTLYLLPANNCQLIFNGSSHGFLHGALGQVRIQGLFAHGNRTAGTYSGLYASQTGQSFSVNHCIFNDWQSGVLDTK